MEQAKKEIEARAKKLGVSLAPKPEPEVAPPAPMPRWLQQAMPAGAEILAMLKGQLDPEIWQELSENLQRGRGYVVDLSTLVAIGGPPKAVWDRGHEEKAPGGFTLTRVTRRPRGPAPSPT